jgi:hypothetical protein
VRGNQLQNPFSDTSWHELVDEDEDDPIIVTDESDEADEADDEALFGSADASEAWPDETLFDGPDDWQASDDNGDEFEAA